MMHRKRMTLTVFGTNIIIGAVAFRWEVVRVYRERATRVLSGRLVFPIYFFEAGTPNLRAIVIAAAVVRCRLRSIWRRPSIVFDDLFRVV
jgi:hypothetical protein